MEDVLRWSLLVLGSCIITGVLVHGIWVSRKNSQEKSTKTNQNSETEQELQSNGWHTDDTFDDSLDNMPNIEPNIDIGTSIKEPSINFSEHSDEVIAEPEQFDDLGIGAVRVVSSTKAEPREGIEVTTDADPASEPHPLVNDEKTTTESQLETKKDSPSSKIYASVVTQPKPEFASKYQSLAAETVAISKDEKVTSATVERTVDDFNISKVSNSDLNSARTAAFGPDNYQAPEPPPFLLKKEPGSAQDVLSTQVRHPIGQQAEKALAPTSELESVESPVKESLSEQAFNLVKRKKIVASRNRREPKIAEDQMRIDFDDQPVVKEDVKKEAPKQATSAQQQEVLVLNVKVADDTSIAGAALLPMLLTLGFKFGDQDIFHRHVNSNGKGPVLFSLANMFKPGVFDIDNLENFTTQGVSLFMILPIEGEPHQVFNMMHNAARKIADEFSAQIYDGRRALLTKQSLQQYVEKIREFERQRMLKR